jgi:hypothetical protein
MKGTDYISPSERLSVWGWWEEIKEYWDQLMFFLVDDH